MVEIPYEDIWINAYDGYSHNKIILNDENRPVDAMILRANPAFCRMFGSKVNEIGGMRLKQIWPDIENKTIELLGEAALDGKTSEIDVCIGEMKQWFRTKVSRCGRYYFSLTLKDITAEKKQSAELKLLLDTLKENEIQFQRIIDNLPFAMMITGCDSTVHYVNSAGLELFELTQDVMGSKTPVLRWVNEEDRSTWLRNTEAKTQAEPYEMNLYTAGGREVWVMSSAIRIKYHGEPCILSTHHDITARKRMEAAIRESEEEYRLLFDNAAEGITVCQDGILRISNIRTEILTGFSRSELEGFALYNLINPEDYDLVYESQRCCVEEGREVTCNFRLVRKDDVVRFIEMKSICIVWQNRASTLNFLSDITTKWEAEEERRKSEEKLKLIFENAAESILVVQNNQIQYCNPTTTRLTAYKESELLSMSFLDMVSIEDRVEASSMYHRLLAGQKSIKTNRFRILKKNGAQTWVESSGVRINWNGYPAVQYFFVDITEQKNIESALAASEEKYRLITEFASDVIWVFNLTTYQFSYISPSVYTLRGYTASEAKRQKLEEALLPQSLKMITADIPRIISDFIKFPGKSETYMAEVRQPCKNGASVWTEISAKLRYNNAGEIEAVGVSRNIEERKKAEEQVLYLSYNDQLTGLYNRRFYEEELRRLDTRRNLPITLVLADVNGLKLTNDAFGHLAGDQLIIKIAQIIKRECRSDDIIARIGGDEFVVLLPHASSETAEKIVSRIQTALREESNESIVLSASFGWQTKSRPEQDIAEIFVEAENSMYHNKLSESKAMRRETIRIIAKTLFEKLDNERNHSEKVADLCAAMARAMEMSRDEITEIITAGLLHDIGKIGVDGKILDKPGELSLEEWKELKRHAETGYQILKSSGEYAAVSEYVLCHHERMDGKGYPRGLAADDIPLQARILSIAEAYDTMTHETKYKNALNMAEAIEELQKNASTQFDEEIVRIFIERVLKPHKKNTGEPE